MERLWQSEWEACLEWLKRDSEGGSGKSPAREVGTRTGEACRTDGCERLAVDGAGGLCPGCHRRQQAREAAGGK